MEETFIEKDKFKFLRIIIFILLIASLIYGCYYLYKEKLSNTNTIITNSLIKQKDNINKLLENIYNNKIKLEGNLSININSQDDSINKLFNNLLINIEGVIDNKENIANIDISTKHQDQELINFNTYKENNNYYIFLTDYYDKYIKLNKELLKIDINIEEYKNISNNFIETLKTIIKDKQFNKKEETITIDNKETNVYNNYLTFKGEDINDIINKLTKSLNYSNEETDKEYIGTLYLNFYTTKSLINQKLIRYEIIYQEDSQKEIIKIDTYNDNTLDISIKDNNNNIDFTINNKKINININAQIDEVTTNIKASFNLDNISNITKKDISNAINQDDLTDDDINSIIDKIGENDELINFINEIQGIEARGEV